jgi:HAD superfamily hydrolase (TIGR01509 family)
MTGYRAVLFDWRLTLAHYPDPKWWIKRALISIGRRDDDDVINATFASVGEAMTQPAYVEALSSIDCSSELHRSALLRTFRTAGLDDDFAKALYELDFDPASHPIYPDVPDVLRAIRACDVKTVLVSNIHFDLRSELTVHGIGDLFDAYVLSFEQGFQKPDPRMFQLALAAVSVKPEAALMVGDSPVEDGAAAAVGIATLLLPRLSNLQERGLGVVLPLLA